MKKIDPRTDRAEYNKAYNRGWNTANRVQDADAALQRADARNESSAWYDGWADAELDREKFHLREELTAELDAKDAVANGQAELVTAEGTVNTEAVASTTAADLTEGARIDPEQVASAEVSDTETLAQNLEAWGIVAPPTALVAGTETINGQTCIYLGMTTNRGPYSTAVYVPADTPIRTT